MGGHGYSSGGLVCLLPEVRVGGHGYDIMHDLRAHELCVFRGKG